MASLDEIEKYFETYNFIGEDVRINECTTVTDLKKFVRSHISILRKNKGNKLYMPYYDKIRISGNRIKKISIIFKNNF